MKRTSTHPSQLSVDCLLIVYGLIAQIKIVHLDGRNLNEEVEPEKMNPERREGLKELVFLCSCVWR